MGLKHSLHDCGLKTVKELHEKVADGTQRFDLRAVSAQLEGGVKMESYEEKTLYASAPRRDGMQALASMVLGS